MRATAGRVTMRRTPCDFRKLRSCLTTFGWNGFIADGARAPERRRPVAPSRSEAMPRQPKISRNLPTQAWNPSSNVPPSGRYTASREIAPP